MLYEHFSETSHAARTGVNAFEKPAVEQGKILARGCLAEGAP